MQEKNKNKPSDRTSTSLNFAKKQHDGDGTLVVIESPDSDLPKYAIKALCEELLSNERVTILLFTDLSISGIRQQLEENCLDHKIIDAAPMLDAEALEFTRTLPALIESLAESYIDQPDFWLTRFTELSLGSPLWINLLRASVTQKVCLSRSFKKCFLVGHEPFTSAIARMNLKQCIPTTIVRLGQNKEPNYLRLFLHAALLWAHNLVAELTAWWLTRRMAKPSISNFLVFTSFPNNWLNLATEKRKAYLRYSGKLAASIKQIKNSKGIYLCTLPRHARTRLKSPSEIHRAFQISKLAEPDMPIVWIEAFGGLTDIILAYFSPRSWLSWFRTWRNLIKGSGIIWNNVDISILFREPIILGALVDWPSNRLLNRHLKRAIQVTKPKQILVPGFEFTEGRTVIRSARSAGIESFGLQHAANSLPHLWRFSNILGVMNRETERGQKSLPNKIFVEGIADAEHLCQAGIKPAENVVVGAPRIVEEIPKLKILPLVTRKLLLLGDLPGARANQFPWWLEWCLGDMAKKFSVVIRPHPTVYKETSDVLQKARRRSYLNVELGGAGTLAEELERLRPMAVVGCITGSIIEVAMRGYPIAIFRTNWLPDMSPFSSLQNSGIFATRNSGEMLIWLQQLENDPEFRENYIRSSFKSANRLVAATDMLAATYLAKQLEL